MDKRELQILSNVLNHEYGFKLICILLERLGAFDYSINRTMSDKELFMHLGKREKGGWLLECCAKANFEKYKDILAERVKENK